jgi:transcription initiation factor TFIID TATA-box-binding protein
MEPKIQNIIATAFVSCRLNLPFLYKSFLNNNNNVSYNPKKFSAVILKITIPKSTILIFCTGKVVITGTKSVEHCKGAIRKLEHVFESIGCALSFRSLQVHNLVGSFDTCFPINVEKLCMDYSKNCIFAPELFPGLKFQIITPKMCVLVFHSGKIILTGAKCKQDLNKGFEFILPILQKYKKFT